jgi:hypothetical protein
MPSNFTTSVYSRVGDPGAFTSRFVRLASLLGVLQGCNSDTLQAPVAEPIAPPASVRQLQLATDTVQAGAPVAFRGERLALAPETFHVTVDGTPVAVDSVAGDRVWMRMPGTSASCDAATVSVMMTGPGWAFRGEVAVAPALRVDLPVGGSLIAPAAGTALCLDVVGATADSARFVFTVMNPVTDAAYVAGFTLSGIGRGALAHRKGTVLADGSVQRLPAATAGHAVPAASLAPAFMGRAADTEQEAMVRHLARLDARALPTAMATAPAHAAAAGTSPAQGASGTALRWQVGEMVNQRVATESCAAAKPVQARVVYAGPTAVLLEDASAQHAGRMDEWFARLGDEYERVMLPLVQHQLGNPLARNAALDGDGRVTLLFTPVVNTGMPGTAAFVNACNLYPRSIMSGSSADEVMYIRVPGNGESPADWMRALRSTLVHETKHLASFAERLSRGRHFEEPWLEEATARLAEELYSRTFRGGGQWLGRTTFASSVHCELVWCDDRPLMMYKHFAVLHQFLRNPATLSPLGPVSPADATPYASAWSLVRSVLDATRGDEARQMRALIRGDAGVGIAALASVSGKSPADMLDQWMADQVDADTRRTAGVLRSWDSGSVWEGLAAMFPGVFRGAPLRATLLEAGIWEHTGTVRGYTAAFAVLHGIGSGTQRVMLQSDARGTARLRVTRVE